MRATTSSTQNLQTPPDRLGFCNVLWRLSQEHQPQPVTYTACIVGYAAGPQNLQISPGNVDFYKTKLYPEAADVCRHQATLTSERPKINKLTKYFGDFLMKSQVSSWATQMQPSEVLNVES